MNLYEIKALTAHNKINDLANKTAVTLSHTFADNTSRDNYFTANPTELVENLFIKVGAGYQQYISSAWESSTAVVADISGIEQDLAEHKLDYTQQVGTVANLTTTSKEVVGAVNELNTNKANKVQEAWITPTLLNGWVEFNQYTTPKYMKDTLGFVHFIGGVKSGALNTIVLNLPVGYRPILPIEINGVSTLVSRITITSGGVVTIATGDVGRIYLNQINFKAEL